MICHFAAYLFTRHQSFQDTCEGFKAHVKSVGEIWRRSDCSFILERIALQVVAICSPSRIALIVLTREGHRKYMKIPDRAPTSIP